MAFQNKELSVIAYANGFTLWHYATEDSIKAVMTDKYFITVHAFFRVGDVIIINASDGTCIKTVAEMSTDGIYWESLK